MTNHQRVDKTIRREYNECTNKKEGQTDANVHVLGKLDRIKPENENSIAP